MNRQVQKIAIIGFGSAGAAAAIPLSRSGFAVDVFEQASAIGPVGAGILLHPSGQLVLDRLQLLKPLAECSEPIEKIFVQTKSGKTLLDIRYDEAVERRIAYGVLRSNLFDGLYQAAKNAGVSFRLSTAIESFRDSDSGVVLHSRDAEEFGPYDLVLLCDGARSRMRSQVVSWSHCWNYHYGARWTLGSCAQVRGRLQQVVHGSKHLIGVLPTGRGSASFFWGTSPGEDKSDFTAWKEMALQFCPHAEELLRPLRSFDDCIETKYFQLFSGPSRHPSIMLLGDAWHAMSPHLGQGTNLALLDGYILARELIRLEGDLQGAKKEFARQRIPNNTLYRTLSFGFSPFFQSGGWLKGELRDIFLPLIAKIPWIRKQMVLSISGLKQHYFSMRETPCPELPEHLPRKN